VRTEHDRYHRREYRYDRAGQLVGTRHWESQPRPWQHAEHRTEDEEGFWAGRRSDSVDLVYDLVGNRTALRQGEHETRYRYDDADQLVAAEAHGVRTEYRYDTSGRLVEEHEGELRRVISYDGFGQPTQ